MRGPWFAAQPVDEGFLDTAPFRLRGGFDVPLPAARVWADLSGDEPLAWCRLLTGIEWTSPRPFGVGTTRTTRLFGGAAAIRERYFRWEEGRRHSFCAVEANVPLFRRLAEDYLVEPTSADSCRFTWTIAVDWRPALRLADPLNRRILETLFHDTRRHYARR